MVKELLIELELLGNAKMRLHHIKQGASENIYGVKLGDIRKIAKRLKTNHQLAISLWETEIIDARLLAIMLIKPKLLSKNELDIMVRSVTYQQVADWLNAYVVKPHPHKEELRQVWMEDTNKMAARAGWSLTGQLISREPDKLDISNLLSRIELEMKSADPLIQWTMNSTLAEIGINLPEFRHQALTIGEKLGVYRDYSVSIGCTSPFAPIWINEMVSRQH